MKALGQTLVDVASPRCSLSEIPEGGVPCQGKTGRLPHNLPPQKANFEKGKIAKFKGEMAILETKSWPDGLFGMQK